MSRRQGICFRGFTLIEVAACLVLVGVLAALTSVSLRDVQRLASFEDVIDRLATWDRLAREQAQRNDRLLQITCDLSTATFKRSGQSETGRSHDRDQTSLSLPTGYQVDRVLVSGQAVIDRGAATWWYDSKGQSPTYAVLLRGPAPRHAWLLWAGGTGQCVALTDQKDSDEMIDALFETLDNPTTERR